MRSAPSKETKPAEGFPLARARHPNLVGEFYSPERGDLILNPLDARCPYWGLGAELDRDETATTIAAAFLPEKDTRSIFHRQSASDPCSSAQPEATVERHSALDG